MAGKDHFHVMLIAVVDGLFVFYRSSWLDDALDSCLMGFLNAIGKWEERITCGNTAKCAIASSLAGESCRIDAILLSAANTHGRSVIN